MVYIKHNNINKGNINNPMYLKVYLTNIVEEE